MSSHKRGGNRNRDVLKMETLGNFTDSVKLELCGILTEKYTKL